MNKIDENRAKINTILKSDNIPNDIKVEKILGLFDTNAVCNDLKKTILKNKLIYKNAEEARSRSCAKFETIMDNAQNRVINAVAKYVKENNIEDFDYLLYMFCDNIFFLSSEIEEKLGR